MLESEVDEKYYISDRQLNGMAITNYHSYSLSTLLKDDDDVASVLKARFEGCPQLVSNGGTEIQRKVANEAIRKGLVKPNDVIEYSYSNARLKEIEEGYIKKQNMANNQISPTLKTNPQQLGVCVESFVAKPFRIRKLTPRECWRLQGFTDEEFAKAEKVCSNAQLYKQAGNSITVNVLVAILRNLLS